MAITRDEAQEIFDLVMDGFDEWISGSDYRNKGGAGINEAGLKDVSYTVAKKLLDYFETRNLEIFT